ncbi:hypothetical protein [Nannocystis pusilla]|uniref:hypothetical protein n=1 Tax=Nannocystis pusilla TaxID=889268 RepID=UPI003B79160D
MDLNDTSPLPLSQQICAAGYPLTVKTHPPDDIPCRHYPAQLEANHPLAIAGFACLVGLTLAMAALFSCL